MAMQPYNVSAGDKIKVQLSDGTIVRLNEFLNQDNLTNSDDVQLQEMLRTYVNTDVGKKQLKQIEENYNSFENDEEIQKAYRAYIERKMTTLSEEQREEQQQMWEFRKEGTGTDLLIKVGNTPESDGAYYSSTENMVVINKKWPIKDSSIIAHELTHALDDDQLENNVLARETEPENYQNRDATMFDSEARAKITEAKTKSELESGTQIFWENNSVGSGEDSFVSMFMGNPYALAKQYTIYKKLYGEKEAEELLYYNLMSAPIDQVPKAIHGEVFQWRKMYRQQQCEEFKKNLREIKDKKENDDYYWNHVAEPIVDMPHPLPYITSDNKVLLSDGSAMSLEEFVKKTDLSNEKDKKLQTSVNEVIQEAVSVMKKIGEKQFTPVVARKSATVCGTLTAAGKNAGFSENKELIKTKGNNRQQKGE